MEAHKTVVLSARQGPLSIMQRKTWSWDTAIEVEPWLLHSSGWEGPIGTEMPINSMCNRGQSWLGQCQTVYLTPLEAVVLADDIGPTQPMEVILKFWGGGGYFFFNLLPYWNIFFNVQESKANPCWPQGRLEESFWVGFTVVRHSSCKI